MSTSNTQGTNYALHIAPPSMNNLIDSALWGGKLRVQVDTGTVTSGSSDINSTIKVGRLKKGDCPIGFDAVYTAMTAALTANIGDGSTANAFGALASMASAGKQTVPSGNKAALTDDTDIVLTLAGANANANGTIVFTTYFTRKE